MSRVGKLVFVERIEADGKVDYYSGEYIVLRETANAIYCVKPQSGYEGHTVKHFHLVGAQAWKVITESPGVENDLLSRLADEQDKFYREMHKPNKHWCDSVYTDAKRNGERMREILAEHSPVQRIEVPAGKRVVITITAE